jgi:hypothetical protein
MKLNDCYVQEGFFLKINSLFLIKGLIRDEEEEKNDLKTKKQPI